MTKRKNKNVVPSPSNPKTSELDNAAHLGKETVKRSKRGSTPRSVTPFDIDFAGIDLNVKQLRSRSVSLDPVPPPRSTRVLVDPAESSNGICSLDRLSACLQSSVESIPKRRSASRPTTPLNEDFKENELNVKQLRSRSVSRGPAILSRLSPSLDPVDVSNEIISNEAVTGPLQPSADVISDMSIHSDSDIKVDLNKQKLEKNIRRRVKQILSDSTASTETNFQKNESKEDRIRRQKRESAQRIRERKKKERIVDCDGFVMPNNSSRDFCNSSPSSNFSSQSMLQSPLDSLLHSTGSSVNGSSGNSEDFNKPLKFESSLTHLKITDINEMVQSNFDDSQSTSPSDSHFLHSSLSTPSGSQDFSMDSLLDQTTNSSANEKCESREDCTKLQKFANNSSPFDSPFPSMRRSSHNSLSQLTGSLGNESFNNGGKIDELPTVNNPMPSISRSDSENYHCAPLITPPCTQGSLFESSFDYTTVSSGSEMGVESKEDRIRRQKRESAQRRRDRMRLAMDDSLTSVKQRDHTPLVQKDFHSSIGSISQCGELTNTDDDDVFLNRKKKNLNSDSIKEFRFTVAQRKQCNNDFNNSLSDEEVPHVQKSASRIARVNPSTPRGNRSHLFSVNTPSTQLSNRLRDVLNFDVPDARRDQGERDPQVVHAFPKPVSKIGKARRSLGDNLNAKCFNLDHDGELNAVEDFIRRRITYKKKDDQDEPMVIDDSSDDDVFMRDVNTNTSNEEIVNDTQDCQNVVLINEGAESSEEIVHIIGREDLSELGKWRKAMEDKTRELRANLPTLNQRVTRIMPPHKKDFTVAANAVPPLCDLGNREKCAFCGALTYAFKCCSNGGVCIPPPRDPPSYIKHLLTGKSRHSNNKFNHFRKNTVIYNNAFAMGSLSYDREKTSGSHPFIKINGMLHHMLSGSSLPPRKKVPLFHQIYRHDVNEATKYRMMNPVNGNVVKPNIVRNLQVILENENYLVKQYRTAMEIQAEMVKSKVPLRNVFIALRSPSEVGYHGIHHPGTLSRPQQEVQSFLYSMEPDGGPGKHDMYIKHRLFGGKLETLNYWNCLLDPVGYPMLFPYGNSGFKRGEYKIGIDYVTRKEDDDEEEYDQSIEQGYPFEYLNDEMEDGVETIDYDTARLKYRAYRRDHGEQVSSPSSASGDDEEFDDVDVEASNLDMETIGSDDEVDENGRKKQPHFFLQDSSEDEGVGHIDGWDLPDSQQETPVNADALNLVNNSENSVPINEEINSNLDDNEISNSDISRETALQNWKKKEDRIRQSVLKKEAKRMAKDEKRRSFKNTCLKLRGESNIFGEIFQNQLEIKKVLIDLEFIERKRLKDEDQMYYLAEVFFNMKRNHVDYLYSGDFKKLHEAIDYEISYVAGCRLYRSNEPKIKAFRDLFIDPSQYNDNMGSDFDDPDDVVQHDILPVSSIRTQELDNSKKKKKKEVVPVKCSRGKRVNISRCQHSLHQMQVRNPNFHPYLSTLMLGQLYVIDLALRIIRQRNDNTRDHMIKLRGSNEKSLTYQMHAASANRKGFNLGYALHLSNERVGSSSWYKDQFQKAMAQMNYTGKPDLFITMTGNPAWREITDNCLPHSNWQSNPFLVNEVFHLKMQELLNDVIENELFGPCVSYCYSIEFQKRGMPHMHLLITLKEGYKLDTSVKIDKYIKANIPEEPKEGDPDFELKMRFRNNVLDHMIHSSCIGPDDAHPFLGSYCNVRMGSAANRKHTRCTKNFPVPFNTHTSTIDGGKVDYHRPDDKIRCKKTVNGIVVQADNRYVVPYNPFLLNKYSCHINCEAVTTVDVVKYIYKYIYKGFDKALAQFIETFEVDDGAGGQAPRTVLHAPKNSNVGVMAPRGLKATKKQWKDYNDRLSHEFRRYNIEPTNGEKLTAYDEAIMVEIFRQMTASEAAWIMQGFYMSGMSHTVYDLPVHEEDDMPFFYRPGEHEKVLKKIEDDEYKSMFLAWFHLNQRDHNARQYTYDQIPLHYKFEVTPTSREWRPYLVNKSARNIGRVKPVSPRFLEKFAIRLLALNTRGPQSFKELRTHDGILYASAHDCAKARGLMDNQVEFQVCLNEASLINMPNRLRMLFVHMLVFGGVSDPRGLWDMFHKEFYDRALQRDPVRAQNVALFHIAHLLLEHGHYLVDFKLPEIDSSCVLTTQEQDDALDNGSMQAPVDIRAEADKMLESLNEDQLKAFNLIMLAVNNNGMGPEGNCFFLQGSGGCGKTYVYRTLYYQLQSRDEPISCAMIATTGIAATLLIKGTTAHRKFKLPLNAELGSCSSMKLESLAAEELRQTTVLIIDESTMASKFLFIAIDNLLKDVMRKKDKPFGGKIVLLGGDWKQLLPVVPGSSSLDAIYHTLKHDDLWKSFKVLTLSKNMRAQKDPVYSTLLENVGNGMMNGVPEDNVRMDPKCIVQTSNEVVDFIYGDLHTTDPKIVAQSCILTSLNTETSEINEQVLDKLPGLTMTYVAIDSPQEGAGLQIGTENFRDDMPSGMPPYELSLKENAVVILLRNLNVSRGLCNGSRLRVHKMHSTFVECELISSESAGFRLLIGKYMTNPPTKAGKKPNYSRLQLPLRLAYAMTISKSQGQTFDRVGIILKNNVFAHGQLYVALSRAREAEKVRIYSASRATVKGRAVVAIRNKVERSVLEPLPYGALYDPHYVQPELVYALDEPVPYQKPKHRVFIHDHSSSSVYQNLQKERDKVVKKKKPAKQK